MLGYRPRVVGGSLAIGLVVGTVGLLVGTVGLGATLDDGDQPVRTDTGRPSAAEPDRLRASRIRSEGLSGRYRLGRYARAATPRRSASPAARLAAPPAGEFARLLVAITNRDGELRGDPRRIGNADCVQAAPGRYMCSYASWLVPGARSRCHLMQARWTPRATSTITITLSGRVDRCGSLREALDSL